MELVIHPGVHHTDDERLLKSLLRNADDFSKRGVAIPGPGKYRTLLKEGFLAMDSSVPSPDSRDILVDAILDGADASRAILSNPHFFGSQRFALDKGQFYPLADLRVQQIEQLFKGDKIEVFMAIRNPATFLPQLFKAGSEDRLEQCLNGKKLPEVLWSETIERIRFGSPDVPITVWCNEDSPLIWSEIMRDMAGLEHGSKINGGFDLLTNIMSREGMKRFRQYLHNTPAMPEIQKRRVIEVFLNKYALDDEVEEELDLEGWTQDLVADMTDSYEDDVDSIARIPGVTLITP
jgi:hypothetical protein